MSNYDKCINMLCMTGKMPTNLIDAICEEARSQINSALKVCANDWDQSGRNKELFGERRSSKNDYLSAFFDYEEEYQDNFLVDTYFFYA